MQNRTLSRELALLLLGQVSDRNINRGLNRDDHQTLDGLLQQAVMTLRQHSRELLDQSAAHLQQAEHQLLDSELQDKGEVEIPRVRQHLRDGLRQAEQALNSLSACLELPRLLLLAEQGHVHQAAIERAKAVLDHRQSIDQRLNVVMEGWRLARLPRLDRDILRLAVIDLEQFNTPTAVACNEAVELAKRYSDEQGRRMINGVLRRFTTRKGT